MITKTLEGDKYVADFQIILGSIRNYIMRLNSGKCSFGIQVGKFIGFILTNIGIEKNPKKFQAIIDMRSPSNVKDVKKLSVCLASISHFLSHGRANAMSNSQT